jgi:NADH-quinone oxidoreductase subunit L
MLPYAAWLVWVIPLGSSLLIPLFGKINDKARDFFAILASLVTAFYAFSMIPDAFNAGFSGSLDLQVNWIPLGMQNGQITWITAGVLVDPLSIIFAILIAFFGVIIAIYSIGYMHGEEGLTRYYFLLQLFIGSMIGLVMADNFLQLFIFWEMVGLCSYGLVSFWYKKGETVKAGMKVFLMTKVGDVFLLAAIVLVFADLGTFSFIPIMHNISHLSIQDITLIAFFLLGAAVAKSAQLPLHTWLYAAMEAPTSISALLHAATMVKAGVYLIARAIFIFSIVLVLLPTLLNNWFATIAWFGVLTALVGGTLALSSPDIKGVQAYSTVSQLGFMIAALGTAVTGIISGGWFASLYQMLSHAFFQGLNFLLIGGIIHAVGTRDMREMGGLGKEMRTTYYLSGIYLITAIGIPPLPTFFSKELILSSVLNYNYILGALLYLATALTFAYALRYFILVFRGEKSQHLAEVHVHEPPKVMLGTSIVLAGICLVLEFFGPAISTFMYGQTNPIVTNAVGLGVFTSDWAGILLFAAALALGGIPVYYLYEKKSPRLVNFRQSGVAKGVNYVLEKGYGVDPLYENVIYPCVAMTAQGVYEYVEKGFFDRLTSGIGKGAVKIAGKIKRQYSGSLQQYIIAALFGIAVILVFLLITWLG